MSLSLQLHPLFRGLDRDLEDMNRRFASFFGPAMTSGNNEALARAEWAPVVDIAETAEAYTLHAELPGLKKEDVKLTVKDGVLTLSGERKAEREEKGRRFHRVERAFGRFQRSFGLPLAVDEGKIAASFQDGVLNVLVPKVVNPPPQAKEILIA